MTSDVFKVTETTHAAYIGTIHKGPGLFSKIGEVQAVPSYAAKVANKWTVTMSDFGEGIEISKNLFDDRHCKLLSIYAVHPVVAYA